MKTKKLLAILCIISATLSGCFLASFGPLPMDVNRKTDYMEYPGGGLIMDCRGSPLSKNSEKTDYFWDKIIYRMEPFILFVKMERLIYQVKNPKFK